MLSKIFNANAMVSLEKSIEATKLRDQVLNHNIANASTPGFKRSYVEFEQYMAAALTGEKSDFVLKRTRRGHFDTEDTVELSGVKPQVKTDNSSTLRLDGNNVDVEHEMNEQAKNYIHYQTLVEQLNSEIRRVRTAMGKG